MCIMSLTLSDYPLPSGDVAARCWERNRDGAGFAFARDGHLIIRKGFMTQAALLEALARCFPTGVATAPVSIHWRIATHGLVTPANTHPWWIVQGKVALLHNGILRKLTAASVTGALPEASDSQWFAALLQPLILGALAANPEQSIFTRKDGKPTRFARALRILAGDFIDGGYPNKVILMDNHGGTLVLGAEKGDLDPVTGTWWSNTGWRGAASASVCDPLATQRPGLPPLRRSYVGTREVITTADVNVSRRPRVRLGDSDGWHDPQFSIEEVRKSFDA